MFRPDALVFFRAKKTRASARNVGKVFNPVVKLVLENQPFLMPEPAEKPSLHFVAVVVETAGAMGTDALDFFADIGSRVRAVSNEVQSRSFILQQVSVALQRGNMASVLGTIG